MKNKSVFQKAGGHGKGYKLKHIKYMDRTNEAKGDFERQLARGGQEIIVLFQT